MAYLSGKLNVFRAVQRRGKAPLLLTTYSLRAGGGGQSMQGDAEDSSALCFFAVGISGLKL